MLKEIIVCIGTERSGKVRARLSLMLTEGKQVLVEHFHSVVIAPEDSLEEIRQRVQAHLAMEQEANGIPLSPWPAIPSAEWAKVEAVCKVFHPERAA